jgi:hypothetical protein
MASLTRGTNCDVKCAERDAKCSERLENFYQVVKQKGYTIAYLERWMPDFLHPPFRSAERIKILKRMAELIPCCVRPFCEIFDVTKKEVLLSQCFTYLSINSNSGNREAFTWLVVKYQIYRKDLISGYRNRRSRLDVLRHAGNGRDKKLLKFLFHLELYTRDDFVKIYCKIANADTRKKIWELSEPIGLLTKAVQLNSLE